MKQYSIPLIAVVLCISTYLLTQKSITDWATSSPKITVTQKEVDAILSLGLVEVVKAIEVRDKLIKDGIDFKKAEHIPALEAQFPIMAAYFREAAQGAPKTKKQVEQLLSQINSAFDKKQMSMQKWSEFHYKLALLFSDLGKGEYKPDNPFASLDNFRWFVYEHDGVLGLQTLNLGFIYGIEVIPLATNKELRADGSVYNPLIFAYHDRNHYDAFRVSPYAYKRFKEPLAAIYHKIESQTDPVERIRDHLVLFMFIHESLPYSVRYWDSLPEVLAASYMDMNRSLAYRFGRNKDSIKHTIFRRITNDIVKAEGLKITKTSDKRYEIAGTSMATDKKVVLEALLTRKDGRLVIQIEETPTKTTIIDTADIQFADFDGILKAITAPGDYSELAVGRLLKDLGQSFLDKYATTQVQS